MCRVEASRFQPDRREFLEFHVDLGGKSYVMYGNLLEELDKRQVERRSSWGSNCGPLQL